MKFIDLFDWENRPLCRRIGIFIYACLWIGTYAFLFSLLGYNMILIAILFVFGLIIFICMYNDKQDVSFNAKDASNMVSPKTIKKNKERVDKLKEKEYKEDERQYKMLKKLIAKEAKSGNKSLYYDESYLFNDVISYRVIERLKAEGFTITDDNIKYTVRNGIGNTWEEEDFGFWIRW